MAEKIPSAISPLYLKAPSGRLFTTIYTSNTKLASHWVLHFPAFAEEMNKSRSMVSRMAREFSRNNLTVMVPDLFGSGDSDGCLGDATWDMWITDMRFLLQWIEEQGAEKITLWGLRLGCLLVSALLDSLDDNLKAKVRGLIFWQPVVNGEQFATQFLRLRVAASMMSGETITVKDLRKKLMQEGQLEVAGYLLNSQMIEALDQQLLKKLMPGQGMVVNWFEVVSKEGKLMNIAARKLTDQWADQGVLVEAETVEGEPFWSTQEIVLAPGLIRASIANIDKWENEITLPAAKNLSFLNAMNDDGGERGVTFQCQGEKLLGIVHQAIHPNTRGVILVVGGPQYRVGSHRQFLLLARDLAAAGIPVFRFDYRGMGDSEGELVGFEHIQEDIRSAVDCFQTQLPEVEEVVLWGLCDAASASAFYAPADDRVTGLVLLNPWVRSEHGEAKAFIKHYYFQRLFSKAFWKKVFKGRFQLGKSLSSFFGSLLRAKQSATDMLGNDFEEKESVPLAERLYQGLKAYKGNVMLILSGNDLTAAEFKDEVKSSKKFKSLLKQERFQCNDFNESDHTFSRKIWRDQVALKTIEWIKLW